MHVSAQAPFFLGAAMTAIGIGVVFFYRRSLRPVEEAVPSQLDGPVVAAELAEVRPGGDVHVLHVVEADIVAGEDAIELETDQAARDLLEAYIAELRESGAPVAAAVVERSPVHVIVLHPSAGALGRPLPALAS